MKIKIADIAENRLSQEQSEALQKYFLEGGTWKDLLKLEKHEVEEVYAVGHKHYLEEEYEKAMGAFSALIQINPYEAKHWIAIGATLQAKELFGDAIAAYELALTLDDKGVAPLFYSAQCAFSLGEEQRSFDFLKQVVEKNDPVFSEKAQFILRGLKNG